VLWRDYSGMSGGQISSRLAISTDITASATLKNLFRCIRPSLRPPGETIMCKIIHGMPISYVNFMCKICIGINKVQYFSAYAGRPAIPPSGLSRVMGSRSVVP
jgi:hypothetical protein